MDGEKLRNIIESSGYSIAEWAEELHLTRRTIYLWLKKNELRSSDWLQVNSAFGKQPFEPEISNEGVLEINVDYKKRYFIEVSENDNLKAEIKKLKDILNDTEQKLKAYQVALQTR